jgi:hypothetical protein
VLSVDFTEGLLFIIEELVEAAGLFAVCVLVSLEAGCCDLVYSYLWFNFFCDCRLMRLINFMWI